MARTSNSNERFKYGICLNDECSMCKEKKVQQIPMRKDLVCTECGKPLRECPPPPPGTPAIVKILIIIAVLAVIGLAVLLLLPGGSEVETVKKGVTTAAGTTEPAKEVTETKETVLVKEISADKDITLNVGESKQLNYTATPAQHDEQIDAFSSDETVVSVSGNTITGKQAGNATVTLTTNLSAVKETVHITVEAAKTDVKTSTTASYGTISLDYGTYTGDLKNGKPHGHGTITYSKSQKIINSRSYVASPGDTFEGDFRDGIISGGIGYWTHDGTITNIRP